MSDQPLEDLLARLERERQAADRLYNDALTALDRAIQSPPTLAEAPGPFDATPLPPDLGGPSKTGRARSIRSVIWRIIGPPPDTRSECRAALVDRVNRHTAAHRELRETLAALVDTVRGELHGLVRFEARLLEYLRTITLYVDTKDRGRGGVDLPDRLARAEQRLLMLKREMDDRPSVSSNSPPASGQVFSGRVESTMYLGFEDRFRGARDEIERRVEDYVPLLAASTDIVDVGCGRGELLGLLRDTGIRARGVDANHAMVEECLGRGLDVERSDALSYLEKQVDGGIGGLVAIQVVEHFEPGYLARFLEMAYHKMRPGAPLVLETINPACWMAFFETYLRDLTHQRPLHADTLRYLVEASGFTSVDVQYRSPVAARDRLDRVSGSVLLPPDLAVGPTTVDLAVGPTTAGRTASPSTVSAGSEHGAAVAALAAALNAHADKLNARLFSSMDYVVIARR